MPTPTTAWEKLAIDVVGPLNNAPQGCRVPMTLIIYYSKWPEIAFAPDVTAATVVKFNSTEIINTTVALSITPKRIVRLNASIESSKTVYRPLALKVKSGKLL